jgi:ADP-ribose pyrophosphatase
VSDAERWKLLASEHVLTDTWIRLRADDCVTSSGVRVSPYYVLEQPPWVSIFAVDVHNQVLLIEEYHHGAGVTGVGLPGGAVHARSETPAEAAARELLEETGYTAGQLDAVGNVWANWGNQDNVVHMFVASKCVSTGTQRLDESENIHVTLVPLSKFNPDLLQQAYHRLNAYMAQKVTASGRGLKNGTGDMTSSITDQGEQR